MTPMTSVAFLANHAGSACRPHRRRTSRGFSLIELMVALALAGVLLLGLAVFFVSSSRSYSEADRVSRQIENGRYASSLIAEEIRHAGFYGEVKNVVNLPVAPPPPSSAIPIPTTSAQIDPCATDIATVKGALPIPIWYVDAPGTPPTCVPDAVSGTDIIVIRRANTTTIPAASAVAGGYYTQTTNCATLTPVFQVAQSGFTLTDANCGATVMPIRQYHVYIYYIAPCSVASGSNGACAAGDVAIPTLKRVELTSPSKMSNPVPLVEGIENIQYEYGMDTNGDGNPDIYTAAPALPDPVTQLPQIVTVRIHILARNTDTTPGFADTKTYNFGTNADGTANTVTPGGGFQRHLYTELVRATNVSQRLESTFP